MVTSQTTLYDTDILSATYFKWAEIDQLLPNGLAKFMSYYYYTFSLFTTLKSSLFSNISEYDTIARLSRCKEALKCLGLTNLFFRLSIVSQFYSFYPT